ncbi:MAG: DNA topoisomerase (ATP-hydrolyzing) subunit B [Candidatus Liptonbacteria bacterium]|nr:DNA topoisomerase (ATP-hydrolyzing) subunit B [Candidatus Liptonbacteria bacterium]
MGSYGAKDIQVLEGLEPVRKRPGMYVGSTGTDGLHHLVWEVADNSIDEAMAGYARNITVELLPDDTVSVTDDGRGIPVEIHPQTKKSTLETVLTMLHAGGKFGGEGYKVSGGLHGVGVSVVNALSVSLRAEVKRDGNLYMQEYVRGVPKAAVKKIGKAEGTGTKIVFVPDKQIFSEIAFDRKRILDHFRQQAFLVKNLRIQVIDRRTDEPFYHAFRFEGGLKTFVSFLSKRAEKIVQEEMFSAEKEHEQISVETAFVYAQDVESRELSFANNIYTSDGGMHLTGFRSALTRTLNDYGRKEGVLKEKDDNLTGDDVREGLIAIVSIKLPNPQFEGQTKARLGNPEARTAVETVINETLKEFLEKRPSDAKRILERCVLSAKARKAARAAKDTVLRKGALEGFMLPGKLADCSSRNASESELFIVEGDSAGGSAKQGRDRRFQAILPLRGKILNVEKARIDKMLASKEIRYLIIALGTAIAQEFNLENLRYHKVVIMTDADVDGAHIRTLLLTMFYRHFLPVIQGGFLYIAQPPLYRIQRGKNIQYAFSDAEKESIIKKGEAGTMPTVSRYKGLGEMNPDQLWDTTMDPAQRTMKQVTVNDAEEADRLFTILMGDVVEPRRNFIQAHAAKVKNLDI